MTTPDPSAASPTSHHDLPLTPPDPGPSSEFAPILTAAVDTSDPPPPYPAHRPRRTRRRRSQAHSASTLEFPGQGGDDAHGNAYHYAYEHAVHGNENESEHTPLLAAQGQLLVPERARGQRPPSLTQSANTSPPPFPRARTTSYASTFASTRPPSLAQTVLSMFRQDDSDDDGDSSELDRSHYTPIPTQPPYAPSEGEGTLDSPVSDRPPSVVWYPDSSASQKRRSWRRYWRPLARKRYWSSLVHLLVVNFPFALAAWVYLFVFTLTGTTLLMALPLGALLCFIDLLGARAFSRAELFLQSRFHGPLPYPLPDPPQPIFTRLRAPMPADAESGADSEVFGSGPRSGHVYERSFYKNTYAMFTDPTSYRALFYFLVIKPAITLLFGISLLVAVPVGFALVVPAPAVLRMARRLGAWQAGVAVEGLCLSVS